jgi:hypothetical protein
MGSPEDPSLINFLFGAAFAFSSGTTRVGSVMVKMLIVTTISSSINMLKNSYIVVATSVTRVGPGDPVKMLHWRLRVTGDTELL